MKARKPFFGANWKMHKGPSEARRFASAFTDAYPVGEDRTVVFFPPSITFPVLRRAMESRADLQLGVQDVHEEREGAHTSAISAPMAADAGAAWSLAGHSERRREFRDTDRLIARKTLRILEAGLSPVLCVGETLDERESGRLGEVLSRQVGTVMDALDDSGRRAVVLAYEPVWAIGTGRSARPADADEAHAIVRRELANWTDPEHARDAVVIYGGSVKPHNVEELLEAEHVDGALVGSASLDPRSFAAICRAG